MRVLMYGIGSVGSTMTRMLLERGATIVGAVAASQENNGREVGELIGLDTQLGARLYTDPDQALALQPDLVVMSIGSYMEDMYEPMKRCIRAGANVISLAEELLYSWNTSPKETAELDALARKHGVRVLCTGHQDGYWVSLASVLMGTCFKVDEVLGQCSWNVDDFGAGEYRKVVQCLDPDVIGRAVPPVVQAVANQLDFGKGAAPRAKAVRRGVHGHHRPFRMGEAPRVVDEADAQGVRQFAQDRDFQRLAHGHGRGGVRLARHAHLSHPHAQARAPGRASSDFGGLRGPDALRAGDHHDAGHPPAHARRATR